MENFRSQFLETAIGPSPTLDELFGKNQEAAHHLSIDHKFILPPDLEQRVRMLSDEARKQILAQVPDRVFHHMEPMRDPEQIAHFLLDCLQELCDQHPSV